MNHRPDRESPERITQNFSALQSRRQYLHQTDRLTCDLSKAIPVPSTIF